jgi:hypothetical protein
MSLNDAVDAALDLGGGVRVALIVAGSFRSDAGSILGPAPWCSGAMSWATSSTPSAGCSRR